MLLAFSVENYRSLRQLRLELTQLNIVLGANGSGKTNLYQALRLVGAASRGEFLETMAREGGLPSAKWAGRPTLGKPKRAPFRMTFGVEFDDLCYRLAIGFPPASDHPPTRDGWFFDDEPYVKDEVIWPRAATERGFLFKRAAASVTARDDAGHIREYPLSVASWELGLAELREPGQFPELELMRQRLAGWRFYHGFRSDAGAPAREPRLGFRSPVLHEDGSNLAASLRTIMEIGDETTLQETLAQALDGAKLVIQKSADRRFFLELEIPGLCRPLTAAELSDGQLRFLCLAAALLSPRPPQLMVFNEPEASLHERLLPAVSRLIARAAEHTQLCLTTHSEALVEEVARVAKPDIIQIEKAAGETRIRLS
jgi:predicted ATPase